MENPSFLNLFKNGKNNRFSGRYFSYSTVENYLKSLPDYFGVTCEGQSVLGRSIYSLEIGKGQVKILLWSQMHGNETTTTKAVFDFINLVDKNGDHPFVKTILANLCLTIIPVLNPDGAENYTRKNANNVDLNRDAVAKSQPESIILQEIEKRFNPDFCFNLHDQRTIFGVGKTPKPATLSFLSPAFNADRDLNPSRKIAMQLIAGINSELQKHIPNQIGRYDDKFNLICVGDFFQSKKIPTLLFEAGHYFQDYEREKTRKYVFLALCNAFQLIMNKSYTAFTTSAYFKIPENRKLFYDIIIRNAKVDGLLYDIAIQYQEKLTSKCIRFVPKVAEIKNLEDFYGYKEIEANQRNVECFPRQKMKIGNVVEKIIVNNTIFSMTLTNN